MAKQKLSVGRNPAMLSQGRVAQQGGPVVHDLPDNPGQSRFAGQPEHQPVHLSARAGRRPVLIGGLIDACPALVQLRLHGLQDPIAAGHQQRLLVVEVTVDASHAAVEPRGDGADRRSVVARLGKTGLGGVQDLPAAEEWDRPWDAPARPHSLE